jgi:putative membrane protein
MRRREIPAARYYLYLVTRNAMNPYAWNFEPRLMIGIVLITAIYLSVTGRLARRWQVAGATTLMRNRFLLAMVWVFVALISPIDTLALVSLSMHTAQHLILILIVPPLIILSIPPAVGSLLLRNSSVRAIAQTIFTPVAVFIIYNAIFVGWHVPGNYDLAIRDQEVHVLEHLMFVLGAILSWWPVYSQQPEIPRSTPGLLILYLFHVVTPHDYRGIVDVCWVCDLSCI